MRLSLCVSVQPYRTMDNANGIKEVRQDLLSTTSWIWPVVIIFFDRKLNLVGWHVTNFEKEVRKKQF